MKDGDVQSEADSSQLADGDTARTEKENGQKTEKETIADAAGPPANNDVSTAMQKTLVST